MFSGCADIICTAGKLMERVILVEKIDYFTAVSNTLFFIYSMQ